MTKKWNNWAPLIPEIRVMAETMDAYQAHKKLIDEGKIYANTSLSSLRTVASTADIFFQRRQGDFRKPRRKREELKTAYKKAQEELELKKPIRQDGKPVHLLHVALRHEELNALEIEAHMRGMCGIELGQKLLRTIIRDKLYDAVIDEKNDVSSISTNNPID